MNFDVETSRRQLIAKRVAAGADTEIGHRCSNLIEQLENYGMLGSGNPAGQAALTELIEKSMSELSELTKGE